MKDLTLSSLCIHSNDALAAVFIDHRNILRI